MTRNIGVLISAALALVGPAALAQEIAVSSEIAGGPNKAFEVSLGIGYAQGFGEIGANMPTIPQLGSAGASLELGLGYRFNPNLLVGVYGGAARFVQGSFNRGSVCSYQAGIQGNWHFSPQEKLDPWIGLGAGWRMLCLNEDNASTTFHGLDLARVQIGLDYQASPTFAIAPVVGVAPSILLSAKGPADAGFGNITDPKVNLFVFGGVQGRFDFFGTKEPSVRIASR